MNKNFSALNRSQYINDAQTEEFDLLIIGGGITGAGIALDATTRGLKVLLLEMQDFGAGTSSRSTKLIHGGLRYLKQLEVALVREVGRERAILHNNAPHLVVPRKMLLPIIEDGSLGKYSTSLGLYVYDLLAGVDADEKRSMHSKEAVIDMEPLLRDDILQGGGLYFEYQTDDARLVVEVLKTAIEKGAIALNYAEVHDFHYAEDGTITGVKAIDRIRKKGFNVYASQIVNAAGPWVDDLRDKDNSLTGSRLHLTKGIHIVVAYDRLPLQQACYFDLPDGRMNFAIPKGKVTYIGTTDTSYQDGINRPPSDVEDVEYILDGVNNMFPSVKLKLKDVESSWAGLRPLIHQEGKSPSELSRKDEIFYAPSGLISIAGGKLTGFRKMAERTVDVVVKELYKDKGRKIISCKTEKMALSGGDFEPDEIPNYILELAEEAVITGINEKQIHDLVYKYGTNTPQILSYFETDIRTNLPVATRLLFAELKYGVLHESVINLCDFIIRRSGRLYFERPSLEDLYFPLLDELEQLTQMSKQQKLAQLKEFEQEYEAVINFKEFA